MKNVNTKQNGFFDPVFGLVLLAVFGVTGAAIESSHSPNAEASVEVQHQVACAETGSTVVQEDYLCH